MAETSTHDYVVVGAGTAGCALAARLSENGRHSVLLLEAGPKDDYLWIHIPIGYGKTMFHPVYNWRFETEPDPGMNGRRIYWPRGRCLGGSSSINGLIYIRGQHEDYDHWAALGNAHSLRGGEPEIVLGEAMRPFLSYGWQPQVMAVEGRTKVILAGRLEAYDVVADPSESRDLGSDVPVSRPLRTALREYPVPSPGARPASETLGEEERRQLASLGYGSAAPGVTATDCDVVTGSNVTSNAAALVFRPAISRVDFAPSPRQITIDAEFAAGEVIGEFAATDATKWSGYPLQDIDIMIFANWLAETGDLIVHASGVDDNGEGCAFVAAGFY